MPETRSRPFTSISRSSPDRGGGADLDLDRLRGRLADQQVVVLPHELHDRLVQLVAAGADRGVDTMPESAMTAISVVPPPMSITMLPVGVSTGSPTPIAAAIGSATIRTCLAPASPPSRVPARRSTSVMPEGTQTMTRGLTWKTCLSMIDLRKMPQHLLGDVEIGDHALLQRPHRQDAVGVRPSIRLARADAFGLAGGLLDATTDGSFETMPFALDIDQGVGRAEIHRDFIRGEERSPFQGGKFHRQVGECIYSPKVNN
jgi:hypothetical protein